MTAPTIGQALRALSAECDGAHQRDGHGFNGRDAAFGNDLALLPEGRLSRRQREIAYRMLKTYRTQLRGLGIDYDAIPDPTQEIPAGLVATVRGWCDSCGEAIQVGSAFRWGAQRGQRLHAPACQPVVPAAVAATPQEEPVERVRPALVTESGPTPNSKLVTATIGLLGPGGIIAQALPGYESRPTQIEVAEQIARGIATDSHQAIEAPTGTGKSLAYLAALAVSVRMAKARDEEFRAVVSTGNKALQQQITDKDAPFVAQHAPFTFALLKGRSNYLCLEKYETLTGSLLDDGLFKTPEAAEAFPAVREWAGDTDTGDVETIASVLPNDLRDMITTDTDSCLGRKCSAFERCWAEIARARSRAADVTIVNHALLLRDLQVREISDGHASILGSEPDVVVLDECFVAGTPVDGRPIETIAVGDSVMAYAGGMIRPQTVLRTFRRKPAGNLMRLTIGDCTIVCTPNHPFLTEDGWRPALNLDLFDMVKCITQNDGGYHADMQAVWDEFHRDDYATLSREPGTAGQLLAGMPQRSSGRSVGADEPAGRSYQDARAQSDARSDHQREDAHDAPRDGLEATGARREREGSNDPGITPIVSTRMGNRTRRSNQEGPAGSAEFLQDRRSELAPENRHRDRREFTQLTGSSGTGSEEGRLFDYARVDRIEILEPGRDATFGGVCPNGLVYNLEVEHDHTYLADGLIVSNCHHLEDMATEAFAVELTVGRWIRMTQRLESLTEKHRAVKASGDDHEYRQRASTWMLIADQATAPLDTFFRTLETRLKEYADDAMTLGDERSLLAPATAPLDHLIDEMEMGAPGWLEKNERAHWSKLRERMVKFQAALNMVASPLRDYVRYCELGGGENGSRRLVVYAKPIEVADLLRERLFDPDLPTAPWVPDPDDPDAKAPRPFAPTVISVSATLAADDGFTYWRTRVGLDQAGELIVGSPFDFQQNAALYLPAAPQEMDPSRGQRPETRGEYRAARSKEILELVRMSRGGAFLLFTSRKALDETYDDIGVPLDRAGLLVLRQGTGLNRARLVEEFRRDGNAVLFGLKSFWEGIDIQGDALRLVVIDKMPFTPPSDPVWSARCDAVDREAGREMAWFNALALPTAVIALKQAAGRLIRSRTDRGCVAVLDGRLLTKRYGERVIRALPPMRRGTMNQIRTMLRWEG